MTMLEAALGISALQVALLAGIAAIDLRRRIIHPGALCALTGVSIFDALANQSPALPSTLVGALFAGGAFGFAYQGGRLFGRRLNLSSATVVFGLGDVWLGAACGLAVGFPGALAVVLLAMLLGGLSVGIHWAVSNWRSVEYRPFTALPYGQNIAAATGFALLFPAQIAQAFAG
ncbi:MAG: prepilin peptidase [Chloroflexi bacterium]|nr:prepilin peptidase [Chloroflexota bacterium]MCY4246284.1 prepilin peptidase [Chloroflexota bacterium]